VGRLQRSPDLLAGFKRPTSKGRKGKGYVMGGQREGRGAKGEEEREVGRRTEGAPIEIMLPNQNPKYATGATAIHLSSPVLIRNHNIRH